MVYIKWEEESVMRVKKYITEPLIVACIMQNSYLSYIIYEYSSISRCDICYKLLGIYEDGVRVEIWTIKFVYVFL